MNVESSTSCCYIRCVANLLRIIFVLYILPGTGIAFASGIALGLIAKARSWSVTRTQRIAPYAAVGGWFLYGGLTDYVFHVEYPHTLFGNLSAQLLSMFAAGLIARKLAS